MGTYLKNVTVLRFENDPKKITVICKVGCFEGMLITPPADPPGAIDGNILLLFKISGVKTSSQIFYQDFTKTLFLLHDLNYYADHLVIVNALIPNNNPESETIQTGDSPILN